MKKFILLVLSGLVALSPLTYPQWIEQTSGTTSHLYAVTSVDENHAWVVGASAKVLRTTDGGTTWLQSANSYGNKDIKFFDVNTGFCIGGYKVYKTVDGGVTWSEKNLAYHDVEDMFFLNSTTGWILCNSGFVMKTTDAGATWVEQTHPWGGGVYSIFFVDENTGYISAASGNNLKTTNGGTTWTSMPKLGSAHLKHVWFSDANNGLMATTGGVYKTSDGGTSWTFIALTSYYSYEYFTCNCSDKIFMICTGGVYTSVDKGLNWTKENTPTFGYASWTWYGLCFCSQSVGWLVGSSGKIVKAALPTRADIIGQNSYQFSLQQNYPNPFNSTTLINYTVPQNPGSNPVRVSLIVYDLTGNETGRLVDAYQVPGDYKAEFNAGKLNSGVYLYRLSVGTSVAVKKLMMIK